MFQNGFIFFWSSLWKYVLELQLRSTSYDPSLNLQANPTVRVAQMSFTFTRPIQYSITHYIGLFVATSRTREIDRDCTPAIRGLLTFATLQNFAISTLIGWLGMLRVIASKHHPIIPFARVVIVLSQL